MSTTFRWRSKLGVAVALFLLYGLMNVFFAIQVPVTQHTGGIRQGQIVSTSADTKVLGLPLDNLATASPQVNDYLVAFMDTMCMMMMAFGILQVAVVWFALRRAQRWALWAVALADVSFIPYFIGWTSVFSGYGVSFGESLTSFAGFWIIVVVLIIVATALGWTGTRTQHAPAAGAA